VWRAATPEKGLEGTEAAIDRKQVSRWAVGAAPWSRRCGDVLRREFRLVEHHPLPPLDGGGGHRPGSDTGLAAPRGSDTLPGRGGMLAQVVLFCYGMFISTAGPRVKNNLSFGGVPLRSSPFGLPPWDVLRFGISMGPLAFGEGTRVIDPRSCGHGSTVPPSTSSRPRW